MEAFGGLLANEPSSGGKKNRLAEALKVCTVIISSEIYVYVQEKKKKQSSTMEACYNIFRILTIFKVVLSGGPIIRKKKRGR